MRRDPRLPVRYSDIRGPLAFVHIAKNKVIADLGRTNDEMIEVDERIRELERQQAEREAEARRKRLGRP